MFQDSRKELSSTEVVDMTESDQIPASDSNLVDERTENLEDDLSDQVPTLAIHEKSSLQNGLGGVSSNREVTSSDQAELLELPQPSSCDEGLVNGDVGSPVLKMNNSGKASFSSNATRPFGSGQRNQDTSFQKVDLQFFGRFILITFLTFYWLTLKITSIPAEACTVCRLLFLLLLLLVLVPFFYIHFF